jgi:hypothetical protein
MFFSIHFQTIEVEIDLTTSHKGYMEWRLCAIPTSGETQDCFNQNLLQLADGTGSQLPAGNTGLQKTQLRLPPGVTCSRCVIQWNYRAGTVLVLLYLYMYLHIKPDIKLKPTFGFPI